MRFGVHAATLVVCFSTCRWPGANAMTSGFPAPHREARSDRHPGVGRDPVPVVQIAAESLGSGLRRDDGLTIEEGSRLRYPAYVVRPGLAMLNAQRIDLTDRIPVELDLQRIKVRRSEAIRRQRQYR